MTNTPTTVQGPKVTSDRIASLGRATYDLVKDLVQDAQLSDADAPAVAAGTDLYVELMRHAGNAHKALWDAEELLEEAELDAAAPTP